MIDREYIKLNTSIQTASNRNDLVPDENGNYPAVIELNLPNNIFKAKDGAKKVDKVSMLTTKMRMSMSETPIAQIPVDDTVDIPGVLASKCQFDVYPFALLNNEQLRPGRLAWTVFPTYKKHIITYKINAYLEDLTNFVELESISVIANNNETFPITSRFFQILDENNVLVKDMDHLMNLCVSSSRQVTREQNSSSILVNDIGTIEQMLEDGLENAITYASAETETIVTISLVNTGLDFSSLTEDLPNLDSTLYLEDYGITVCFWKSERENADDNNTSLISACKPKFSFDAQTMSLSYDSAPFSENVPVVWNQAYVNTFERPEQLTLDTLREDMWITPPPKRKYQYDVSTSSEPDSYNFALDSETDCGVMNLIGNKMMKETFSFLPWIKVDLTKISQLSGLPDYQYKIEYTKDHTRKKTGEGITSTLWKVNSTLTSNPTYKYIYVNVQNFPQGVPENVVWYRHDIRLDEYGTIIQQTTYFSYAETPVTIPLNDIGTTDSEARDVDYSTYTSYDEPIIVSSGISVYDQYSTNFNVQGTIGREDISSQDINVSDANERRRNLSKINLYEGNDVDPAFVICWLANQNGKPVGFHLLDSFDRGVITKNTGFALGGAVPDVEPDMELSEDLQYGETLVSRIWVLDASLRSVDGVSPDPRRTIIGFSRVSEEGDDTSYIQENDTTDYVDTVDFYKTTTLLSSIPKYEFIPNLDLENGTTFYMLDCISSKVNIGEQEVVNIEEEEEELYRVTQTISTWTDTHSTSLQWENGDHSSNQRAAMDFNFWTQGFTTNVPYTDWRSQWNSSMTKDNVAILLYIFWKKTGEPTDSTFYNAYIANDSLGAEAVIRPVNSRNLPAENLHIVQTTDTTSEETTNTNTFITSENILPGTTSITVTGTSTEESPIVCDSNPTRHFTFNLRKYHQGASIEPMVQSFPGLRVIPHIRQQGVPGLNYFPMVVDYFTPLPEHTTDLFQGTGIDPEGMEELWEFIPPIMRADGTGGYAMVYPFEPNPEYTNGDNVANSTEAFAFTQHFSITDPSSQEQYDLQFYYFALNTGPPPANTSDPTAIWPHSYSYTCSGGIYSKTQDLIEDMQRVTTTEVIPIMPEPSLSYYKGNVRLNFTWDNLPTVTLSPISSFVLTLAGARVTDEIQPVNVADNALASAQLSTIPIIENYYSTASTLRDLHDELIVIRDQVTNAATYTLANTGGEERTLKFAVKYITKDGKLHQVYIPPNGVFTLQLTFILDLVSI